MTTAYSDTLLSEQASILTAVLLSTVAGIGTARPEYKLAQAVLPTKTNHEVLFCGVGVAHIMENGRILPVITLWNRGEGKNRHDAIAVPADTGRAWIIAPYKTDEVNDIADLLTFEWEPDKTEWIFDDDPQFKALNEARDQFIAEGFSLDRSTRPNVWIVVRKEIFA